MLLRLPDDARATTSRPASPPPARSPPIGPTASAATSIPGPTRKWTGPGRSKRSARTPARCCSCTRRRRGSPACSPRRPFGAPIADAMTDEGTRHQVWRDHRGRQRSTTITRRFEAMPAIWIADGHHRSAAAARVAEAGASAGTATTAASSWSAFPADQMRILDYNRVVRDLNGHAATASGRAARAVRDRSRGRAGATGAARRLRHVPRRRLVSAGAARHAAGFASPVERLDVSLLNDRLLAPILGIADPRTDPRIDFVGGGRGLAALEERVARATGRSPSPAPDASGRADGRRRCRPGHAAEVDLVRAEAGRRAAVAADRLGLRRLVIFSLRLTCPASVLKCELAIRSLSRLRLFHPSGRREMAGCVLVIAGPTGIWQVDAGDGCGRDLRRHRRQRRQHAGLPRVADHDRSAVTGR